jgi:NTE family protein
LIENQPEEKRNGLRHIDLFVVRPSQDLGRLANEYEADLPKAFRFLTRGLGTRETRSNDMLSLVMFQPDYVKRLTEMGESDAQARLPELKAFLA